MRYVDPDGRFQIYNLGSHTETISYSDFVKVREDLKSIVDKNKKKNFLHSIYSGIANILGIIPGGGQAAFGAFSTVDGLVSFISSLSPNLQEKSLNQINEICTKISDYAMENNIAPDVDIKITTEREGFQELIQGIVPIQNRYFAKYTDKITIYFTLNGKTEKIPLPPVETKIGYFYLPLRFEDFPRLEEN